MVDGYSIRELRGLPTHPGSPRLNQKCQVPVLSTLIHFHLHYVICFNALLHIFRVPLCVFVKLCLNRWYIADRVNNRRYDIWIPLLLSI